MNKYKKLFGNTLVFAVGSFGTKLLGFLLVALYTRVMSEGEYSTVDLIYQTVNILVPLVTFSMSDAVIRFGMDNEYDHRKVYTCANLCVLFGMTVFMLFTPLVSKINTIGDYSFLLYIYCYFSCFRQIASQYVRARGVCKALCGGRHILRPHSGNMQPGSSAWLQAWRYGIYSVYRYFRRTFPLYAYPYRRTQQVAGYVVHQSQAHQGDA